VPSIGGGGLVGLVSAAVIMFVTLILFFGLRNLSLVLGADKLTALLFGRFRKRPDRVRPDGTAGRGATFLYFASSLG